MANNLFTVIGRAHGGKGAGHRFGNLVFAYLTAKHLNADFFIESKDMRKAGEHGNYPDMQLLFNFTAVEAPIHVKTNTVVTSVKEAMRAKHAGQKVVLAQIGAFFDWPNAYNAARPFFQTLHKHSETAPIQFHHVAPAPKGSLTVAWHVRVGDILLRSEQFYQNVFETIISIANRLHLLVTHYLVSQNARSVLRTMPNVYSKMDYVASTNFLNDILCMARADILVSSGSSLVQIPAIIAHPQQVFIESPPKEHVEKRRNNIDKSWQTFHLHGSVPVNETGIIKATEISRLFRRLTLYSETIYQP